MFLSKYGVARHIYIPIIKRAVVDFAVGADWTPAGGDVKISKDGGAAANVTNLPVAIAMGNGAVWDFSLTATEMQAAQIVVTIADSATKAVEDQSFIIETHGNASAQFQVDLADSVRAGLTALPNAAAGVSGGLPTIDAALNVSTFAVDSGTAQAGAAATITLRAGASATDSLYNGSVITIYGGTGAGQSRTIVGYVGATKVATVGRNWATNPDNTSVYKIHGLAVPRVDDNLAVIVQAGTGTGQLDFTSGVVKANLAQILGTALTETAGQLAGAFKKFFNIAAPAATMDHGVLVDTVTTYTGNTPQTGDNFTRLGAPAGASHAADMAAIKVDTAAVKVQTDKLAFTIANQIDANVLDWKGSAAPAMTGDAFARLGAPAGASVSADVAAVKSVIGAPAGASIAADIAEVEGETDSVIATLGSPAGASVSADVAAIKGDTGTILTDVNSGAGAIYNRLGAPAGASIAADIAELATETDNIAAIKTQTDKLAFTVPNQVDVNVVDWKGAAAPAMTGDAYALLNTAAGEPGQGAPPVSASPIDKIRYVYKGWRNKKTQNATTFDLFNDAGSVVDQKSTVSDDGTTATRGLVVSGP